MTDVAFKQFSCCKKRLPPDCFIDASAPVVLYSIDHFLSSPASASTSSNRVVVGAMSLPLATTVHKCPEPPSQCASCDAMTHFTASVGDLQHQRARMSFSDIPSFGLFNRFFAADGRDCRADSSTHLLSGYANPRHAPAWCKGLSGLP